jgi:hypothetical protein
MKELGIKATGHVPRQQHSASPQQRYRNGRKKETSRRVMLYASCFTADKTKKFSTFTNGCF